MFAIGLAARVLATIWVIVIPLEKSIFDQKPSGLVVIPDSSGGQPSIVVDSSNSYDERKPLIDRSRVGSTEKQIKKVEKILQLSLSLSISIQPEVRPQQTPDVIPTSTQPSEDVHWYVMFKDLIDIQNVRDMWKTCTKRRSDGKRGEIWILLMSLTVITLTNNGSNGVMFQFVQKVFEWNAEVFSIVNASTLLITSLSVVVIVPTLIKICHLSNMSLSIVGIISILSQNLIRGTLLNAEAFYVSYAFGSMAYVPAISVRSQLSTIVEQTEENKVFGLLATFETMTPFVGSILYNTLFSATIATYPGLVFHFSAALLLIPFIGFVYIANYCK